jgi:hypothetical protein
MRGHLITHGNCVLAQNGAVWEMKYICLKPPTFWSTVLLLYCGIQSEHVTKDKKLSHTLFTTFRVVPEVVYDLLPTMEKVVNIITLSC